MNPYHLLLLLLLSALLTQTACSPRIAYGPCQHRLQSSDCISAQTVASDSDLIQSSEQAIARLLQPLQPPLAPANLLWVTTLADINDLDNSSPLGRLLGEQLGAALTRYGYQVMEPKQHHDLIVIPHTGEFVLSRHLRHIGQQQNVGAVLAGTYAVAEHHVFITLKLLSMGHGRVMSAYAYRLPIGQDVQALLGSDRDRWWW